MQRAKALLSRCFLVIVDVIVNTNSPIIHAAVESGQVRLIPIVSVAQAEHAIPSPTSSIAIPELPSS
jgi:hypothetical protein